MAQGSLLDTNRLVLSSQSCSFEVGMLGPFPTYVSAPHCFPQVSHGQDKSHNSQLRGPGQRLTMSLSAALKWTSWHSG